MQASMNLCCSNMYLIVLDFSFIKSFSDFSLLNVCSLFQIWVWDLFPACARADPNILTSDTVWWCQPPPQECPWDQEVLRGIEIWKISLVTTAQLRSAPCRLRILVWIFSELEELSPVRDYILMLRGTNSYGKVF